MADDYEIIPLEEIKKLKEHIKQLEQEKAESPAHNIAITLSRLSITLEKLFQIFDVAAAEIKHDDIHEKNFEEKIEPIVRRLKEIERQNHDIAEGMLALVDLVKKQESEVHRLVGRPKVKVYEEPKVPKDDLMGHEIPSMPPLHSEKPMAPSTGPIEPPRHDVPPPVPPVGNMPPPSPAVPPPLPPEPKKKGFFK